MRPADVAVEIRPTRDLREIRRLGVAAGLEDDGKPPERILGMWGAFDGERMIGGVVLEMYRGLASVTWMVVDGAYRGRGIGRLLLERVESEARALHVDTLWLNARTPGFYIKHGYTVVGGGGEREMLMADCLECSQYEIDCHPKIVNKTLAVQGL